MGQSKQAPLSTGSISKAANFCRLTDFFGNIPRLRLSELIVRIGHRSQPHLNGTSWISLEMGFSKSIALDDKKLGGTALAESAKPSRSEAEAAFIEKLRAGDTAAFEQMVNRYSPQIYGLLYRITKDPEEASDITQDTFLRAFKGITKFRGDSSVKTWLYRIAINQSRNRFHWWKRRKRHKTVSLDDPAGSTDRPLTDVIPGSALTPEEDALRREQGVLLESAIRKLPEHFREAVVLCDVQGFAYEEIASILEINVGTVKSRISRGRSAIRQMLSDI